MQNYYPAVAVNGVACPGLPPKPVEVSRAPAPASLSSLFAREMSPNAPRYSQDELFQRYESLFPGVEGWLHWEAVQILRFLNAAQLAEGVRGNLAEIGAYQGKLSLAMATFLRPPKEHLLVIDVFDEQHLNTSRSGVGATLAAFGQNFVKLGADLDAVRVFRKRSDAVKPSELGTLIRFFSVDGGHSCEETRADLLLAAQTLHPCGMIVLDDYFNGDWPGVAEGVSAYFRAYSDLAPLMAFYNKFIFVKRESLVWFQRLLEIHGFQDFCRGQNWSAHRKVLHGFDYDFVTAGSPAIPPAVPSQTASRPTGSDAGGNSPGPAPKSTVDGFLNEANLLFSRGEWKAGCAPLKNAATVAPQDVAILTALGNVCFRLGDFQEARAQFDQALRFDPQNVILHVQLATTCQRLGDSAGLTAALQKALALDPRNEPALTLLAVVHFQSRRFGDAAKIYEQLAALSPAKVEFLLPLAKCRFHLGNLPGSRELYEQVRRIEPGNLVAVEALTILQSSNPAPRYSTIQDIIRENPAVHRDHNGNPLTMPISNAVASFIQAHVKAGDHTIETGAGLSTLCFLAQGATHTAIAPDPGLEGRMKEYCQAHGIRHENLTYIAKFSQDAVWGVEGQFDCALIDGGHGFPIPFIDFLYLNRRLKKGGFLIIDDLEIWTGEILAKFLSCEPAWKLMVQDGARSIMFQKVGDAQATEWTQQEFVVRNSLHPSYLETVIPRQSLGGSQPR